MGVVNYSSLLPSLPTGKLPGGSECQLYGCVLSSDDTSYWVIDGESCNVPLAGTNVCPMLLKSSPILIHDNDVLCCCMHNIKIKLSVCLQYTESMDPANIK